ncbi:hypothetical protein A6D6_01240 [Alcanivorax xiamenensis]|uniref:DUF2066 domain-containing protein n=1 Tax=Alcanivorax xiamenensis TaxID=1177156 RepID=A0ABQ6YAI3_9GAMM|nr:MULTISPECIES: DUF2066 domain-containing protein [Alcanivorax]KAF0806876.1 hypothetical protein A6D6_01240 [Alcanivorax xiamenensis]
MTRLLCCVLILLALAPGAGADTLGQVSLPATQGAGGEAPGEEALRDGLERLTRRLTGQAEVADLPGVAAALEAPDRWLQAYRYQQDGDATRLELEFDGAALRRYLANQGAPVWRGEPPTVLVWMVAGSGRGSVVGAGDDLADAMTDVAAQRGVTLRFPAWDEQDREGLTVADIRGRFDEPVLAASRRYGSDWVATAVLYDGRQETLNWRLMEGRETVTQDRDSGERGALLSGMVTAMADTLTERYGDEVRAAAGGQANPPASPPTSSPATPADGGPMVAGAPVTPTGPDSFDDMTLLAVRGIGSLRDLTALRQALSQAPGVASVEVRSLDGDQVLVQVSPAGLTLARDVAGLSECGESQGRSLYCWQP